MPLPWDISGWLVIGVFFVNLAGVAHMVQSIEDWRDNGCLTFVAAIFGLMLFLGLPWLVFVGIRQTVREIR